MFQFGGIELCLRAKLTTKALPWCGTGLHSPYPLFKYKLCTYFDAPLLFKKASLLLQKPVFLIQTVQS